MWLTYTDDEVARFHPEFEACANQALTQLGLAGTHSWQHHYSAGFGRSVPDYVLIDQRTAQWLLVVEIKRRRDSVAAERFQNQSKGYAESNARLYPTGVPRYFSITNLEETLLFALRENSPVRECRVEGMAMHHGIFGITPVAAHKRKVVDDLKNLITFVTANMSPMFEHVWPGVVQNMLAHVRGIAGHASLKLTPGVRNADVRQYFAGDEWESPLRECLLRCLLAAFVTGVLVGQRHPKAGMLPTLSPKPRALASLVQSLLAIDCQGVFEPGAVTLYNGLNPRSDIGKMVVQYLACLRSDDVTNQARLRHDAYELPDVIVSEAFPPDIRDSRGKVQTDAELASLLCTLSGVENADSIYDPGCGDGSLLSAAYDLLRQKGLRHADILRKMRGTEADPFSTKIAILRLLLKTPSVLAKTDTHRIECGDMFDSPKEFNGAQVILMNPPFRRYEAAARMPALRSLRTYYEQQLVSVGAPTAVAQGQTNLYNYYIAYAIQVADVGARLGFVLDNRWFHKGADGDRALREFILGTCQLVAIVTYPHALYFQEHAIATTLVILKKGKPLKPAACKVCFIRAKDPRTADFAKVADAIHKSISFPVGWCCNSVPQSVLDGGSWQRHFWATPGIDYRAGLPPLKSLFSRSRRGSLRKEGGGVDVFEFPFNRRDYGFKRSKARPAKPYKTMRGRRLTKAENQLLSAAAAGIGATFRGYAVQNADTLTSLEISAKQSKIDQTLEAPRQRSPAMSPSYFAKRRRSWDSALQQCLADLMRDAHVGGFVAKVQSVVGLTTRVLPTKELWNVLREPYAGELVIPRKVRLSHKVHINPFAYKPSRRQLRLSSNFFSFSGCVAYDGSKGLTQQDSVLLIASFLLSSFGQYQFEIESHSREGVRSTEEEHLDRVVVFNPQWVDPLQRTAIINATRALPFPVNLSDTPGTQPGLKQLDELWAQELCSHSKSLAGKKQDLLDEVWELLAGLLEARRPHE